MKSRQYGFTLLELMMVVAVIGILTSLALPSYQAYLYRAKAVQVIEVLDKAHTALAGFQAEKGTLNTRYCLSAQSRGTPGSPAIDYHATGNLKDMGSVAGLTMADTTLTDLGLRIFVVSCTQSAQTAGQYAVLLHPARANDLNARQVALAVRQIMQGQTYKSTASSIGTVTLYFQL